VNQLSSQHITCPYCGESIELVIDCSIPEQEYIEDCEVCCRPINLLITIEGNKIHVIPKHEND